MKKASTILLWISLGIGLLYAIATVVGALIGGVATPVPTENDSVYIIGAFYHIVRTALPLTGMLMFALVILFTMKAKSENIVAEILAIILFSGGGVLINSIITSVMNIVIARMMGSTALASYSYMNMGANWVGFLRNIANTLFIVGVSFAIAYKKVELADLRRILQEEDA